ncbi:hypothetical protein IAT38_001505 [Cryptococcus sp. DSM 104549]
MTGYGTPSVAVATTPTVISTFFSHLFARRKRKHATKKSLESGGPGGGPENQLSYEEGLKVVRRFLDFASHHGVEEVQGFTAMWVPTPHWVKKDVVTIPDSIIRDAEDYLSKHLATYGPHGAEGGGLKLVGGEKWWRVRRRPLEGEWIEMQKDYLKRSAKKAANKPAAPPPSSTTVAWNNVKYLPHRGHTVGSVKDSSGGEVLDDRVILYIHGGAFFFSSLETHRYQVQRHVRKAGARAFSPAYRLSPQYPFPCGLLDSLAAYLYLITPPPGAHQPILPTNIIFMGDSAGGGMIVSLLILIREMGLPMPAGASLISPWVDLTHSMPSIGGWDGGDFIPSSGFHYKPSCAWPPLPGGGVDITMPDGTHRHVDEQVQMYCPNDLLTHPLVSPVNQGSLGGLCPLLIIGGGAELLRDEIIYLAHKAAEPTKYPPSSATLAQYPEQEALVDKYKPTKVHLQIYEGCCHVVPTMSWTKSAKYMYRACASFNIWAFTAAHKALERKLEPKKSQASLRPSEKPTPTPSLKKHRSLASLFQPSRANTGSSGDSAPTPPPLSIPSSNALSGTTSSRSPSTHSPSTGVTSPPSSRPSGIDLTQPIISSAAASAANVEPIDASDVQSEAESDSDSASLSSAYSSASQDEAGEPRVPATGIVTVSGSEPLVGNVVLVCERVSTHGKIRPFEPAESVPALQPSLREHIGQIHGSGAIQKWLAKRALWDDKYSKELVKWREIKRVDREQAEKGGFLTRDLQGEKPPLGAVVGIWDKELARQVGRSVDEVSTKTSAGMGLWVKWGTKADKEHADRGELREIKSRADEETRLQAIQSRASHLTRAEAGPYGDAQHATGTQGEQHRQMFVDGAGVGGRPRAMTQEPGVILEENAVEVESERGVRVDEGAGETRG